MKRGTKIIRKGMTLLSTSGHMVKAVEEQVKGWWCVEYPCGDLRLEAAKSLKPISTPEA